jgi:hypothetical protein
MALFPMSGVLRGFHACDVLDVRLGENPCAALLTGKTAHFQIGNPFMPSFETISFSDGH